MERPVNRALGVPCRVIAISLGLTLASMVYAASTDTVVADERLEASYNASSDFIRYPTLDVYLLQVVHRLAGANPDASGVNVRIHALRSALPYSFMLDNGASYVSTGLLARLEDENQLAALIAMPLAAVARHDRQNLKTAGRQHVLRSFLPNLLLIAATAGLGTPALVKADAKAVADEQTRFQTASDAVALRWLAQAGYDPKAAPAALRQLRDLLAAEQRSGSSEFSDAAALTSRADSLDRALADGVAPTGSASPVDPTRNFHKVSVYYALRQAAQDIEDHSASVGPILDRIEANQGQSGSSTFLRAELTRRNSTDEAGIPVAIGAYQRCIAHSDAPAPAYRELAFLYRRAGDAEHAKQNFNAYLAHAPNAADAPIIRTYLENP